MNNHLKALGVTSLIILGIMCVGFLAMKYPKTMEMITIYTMIGVFVGFLYFAVYLIVGD